MNPFLNADGDILIYLQDHVRNSVCDPFFKLITHLGDAGIFWIILTVALLCFKQTRKAGLCSMIALLGSVVLNNVILKPLIARPRPFWFGNSPDSKGIVANVEGLKCIVKEAKDYSFPSGHTAASFASAVALYPSLQKKYSVPLFILAALIAFSRLYIGIHYPTDVLVGLIDGIFLGIMGALLGNYIYKKFEEKKAVPED
ncbi:MAG: phosphatase PAP2 family protein [Lachnospiraceae bacterium]|nr:phosphatase PAP2 family protein [Lachnospiraceae bacterium]